jgi:hypothetical protein
MDEPRDRVIRVTGALAPHWTAHLGGLRIAPAAGGGDGEVLTELRGESLNQTAVRRCCACCWPSASRCAA